MITVDAATVVCTNCNARTGQPCTQPTNTGRVKVSWYHLSREAEARRVYAGREEEVANLLGLPASGLWAYGVQQMFRDLGARIITGTSHHVSVYVPIGEEHGLRLIHNITPVGDPEIFELHFNRQDKHVDRYLGDVTMVDMHDVVHKEYYTRKVDLRG